MFERSYLINLKRRPDRLAAFDKLRKEKGWELPEPYLFPAIDGNKVGVPEYYQAGGGAWGCCRSHVRILEECVMDDVSSVLVLEDDVTWMSDTWPRLKEFLSKLPGDWDQLMLGGQHHREPTKVAPGVVRCVNVQRTHAYVIRGRAMKDLLGVWYKCNTHIDHVMGPWQDRWRVYAPDPFLFGQGAGTSDISGNRDGARFWIPPSISAPVVHLTAPKEVARQLRERGLHTGYMRDPVTDYDLGLSALVRLLPATGGRTKELRKWLNTILWEAASEEGSIATVWHPDITPEMIEGAYDGTVIRVAGGTLEECLPQIPKDVRRKATLWQTHVILLRSPRGVMEALRGHGWHSGYWRDDVSGQDNGLRAIAQLTGDVRADKLRGWVDELAREAERIANGVVCVWHPEFTPEEIRGVTDRKLVIVDADTVGSAIQQFQEGQ